MTEFAQGKRPRRAAPRREQILEAALALFNDQGTAAVSTNHIATRAGVSPGNLYYWFPDKQAIVRALFEEWRLASAPAPVTSTDPGELLRALVVGLAAQPAVSARFAFFARELFSLLHADPELAQAYRRNVEARVADQEAAIAALVAAGLLHDPHGRVRLRDAIMTVWIASETATAFLDLVEPEAGPDRAPAIASAVLRALLTERGAQEIGEVSYE